VTELGKRPSLIRAGEIHAQLARELLFRHSVTLLAADTNPEQQQVRCRLERCDESIDGLPGVLHFAALEIEVGELVGSFALARLGEHERVVVPVGSTVRVGEAVRIAVRPERVQMGPSNGPVATGGSRLDGTIAEIVYLGMYTQFHVDTRLGRVVCHRLADESLGAFETGSPVALTWESEHAALL